MDKKKLLILFILLGLTALLVNYLLTNRTTKKKQSDPLYIPTLQAEPTRSEPVNLNPVCKCEYQNDPVCGTDNVTYRNECDARCVAIEVAYRGNCQDSPVYESD